MTGVPMLWADQGEVFDLRVLPNRLHGLGKIVHGVCAFRLVAASMSGQIYE
jgi:hypothetical protein